MIVINVILAVLNRMFKKEIVIFDAEGAKNVIKIIMLVKDWKNCLLMQLVIIVVKGVDDQ